MKKTLLITGIALFLFNERQKRNDNPKVYYVKSVPGGYNALTIPPIGIFMNIDQKGNVRLLQHEMVHWMQYQREGLVNFTRNYLKNHKELGYDLNPYEIEARILSGEKPSCVYDYSECVRNGEALTVKDNNFRNS